MRWVTRRNAAVDRIACPWLIPSRQSANPQMFGIGRAREMAGSHAELWLCIRDRYLSVDPCSIL
jgi:hypothetical protein